MDKIADVSAFLNPFVSGGVKPETKKTKEKRPPVKAGFSKILEEASSGEAGAWNALGPARETAPSEEALRQLLDDVHSAGDALRERPFKEEILAYKRAVRDFLHYVVENSFDVEKQTGLAAGRRAGYKGPLWEETAKKRKTYNIITVADKKLEQLAAGILSGQSSQLELLSKLEEIKGLLVDLVIAGDWKDGGEKG